MISAQQIPFSVNGSRPATNNVASKQPNSKSKGASNGKNKNLNKSSSFDNGSEFGKSESENQ